MGQFFFFLASPCEWASLRRCLSGLISGARRETESLSLVINWPSGTGFHQQFLFHSVWQLAGKHTCLFWHVSRAALQVGRVLSLTSITRLNRVRFTKEKYRRSAADKHSTRDDHKLANNGVGPEHVPATAPITQPVHITVLCFTSQGPCNRQNTSRALLHIQWQVDQDERRGDKFRNGR